jgi:D-inositol-3-phosphate glycosyltransferase
VAAVFRPVRRVGMIVVHSNPLAEPGAGDAGGMTVYVREMARTLAARGIEVDIYTRLDGSGREPVAMLHPGVRVIQVPAGDPLLAKGEIPAHLPEFTANVLRIIEERGASYDLLHSHYWLSGRVASILQARLGVPFVHTFHTLGRVKNHSLRAGDVAEPQARLAGEARVIAEADAIVASTPGERDWLVDLYAAHPERIHVVPPGVDHSTFSPIENPAGRDAAKRALGLDGKKVLLFVGRLQPLKAADTAISALGHLVEWGRLQAGEARLIVVGGPSGAGGQLEAAKLRDLAQKLGIAGAVTFIEAQPQSRLPGFYQAADVCLVPSYTESFGLVALEAQACGTPVVASAIGGLRTIVKHGQTGFLVEPGAATAFAERTWRILSDPLLAESMCKLAVCSSNDFSWDTSAAALHDLYASSLARSRRNFSRREEITLDVIDGPLTAL